MILRTTLYPPDGQGPTLVMREIDLKDRFDDAVKQASTPLPGAFIAIETFDMSGEPSILEATFEAERRHAERKQIEDNMAILYHWDSACLRQVSDTGLVAPTRPAPLSLEDIETTLVQIAHHPYYCHQTVMAFTKEGVMVSMRDGICRRSEMNIRS